MKKKVVFVVTVILCILVFLSVRNKSVKKTSFYTEDNISYGWKVDEKYFYHYSKGEWKKEFIKGVNMGVGKPGAFPGEHLITKAEYLRWFKYIGEMNANTIRVYTILRPQFYDALLEYNKTASKPLYVMHGVWVNEEDIARLMDAHNKEIKEVFKSEIQDIVDVIHGNKILPRKMGHAFGSYSSDVSEYISGWILGIEWDPYFVQETNSKNISSNSYDGKYLYTEGASSFEAFLCEVGDLVISYESEKYGNQRPISFTNWVTTDMLSHENEPLENEDLVTVNIEHLKSRENFLPGLFASYHIYPYYPDLMNYEKAYAEYIDENGNKNPYRAYLKDLIKEHNMPVVVAEFGVPSSRGMAHVNIHSGFNQGNIEEKEQGRINASMLEDIYEEGYAGAILFSWQDEWFKRTWNTMDLDIPERRPYWQNLQTNEQSFGLLAFDPGNKKSVSYVDGNAEEWKDMKPVSEGKDLKIYAASDEGYLYIMADTLNYDENKDTIIISLDTLINQGNNHIKDYNIKLKNPAEFIIKIKGNDESRIMVDAYYDSFYYIYGKGLKSIPQNSEFEVKNSGVFNNQYLCLNKELLLPKDNIKLPFSKYETGKLVFGNGNPSSSEYNSLTDYIIKDGKIEIRIPWQLLNYMDPSTKMVMSDLYIDGIKPIKSESINIEGIILSTSGGIKSSEPGAYTWDEWDLPTYHERLKPSYYIIKEAFQDLEGRNN